MNEKIAAVASAGTDSGRMIVQKMRRCPAPSMWAAWSSSVGMERTNWVSRKM